jgi:hypothetical protein
VSSEIGLFENGKARIIWSALLSLKLDPFSPGRIDFELHAGK